MYVDGRNLKKTYVIIWRYNKLLSINYYQNTNPN